MSSATTALGHRVIRASAGTGKTYQLSNRFIALAAGGAAPDSIVASTFARKAACEILERILVRVSAAALDGAAADQLALATGAPIDCPAAAAQLRQLLSGLHRLRIGTLDSFFMKLAGHFGLELGLPPQWRIASELDDARYRAEAIRELLGGLERERAVTLLSLLSKGQAVRGVADEIHSTVKSLYTTFLATTDGAWKWLAPRKGLRDDELIAAIEQLEALPPIATKNGQKAHLAAINAAKAGDFESFIGTGIAKKVAAGEAKFDKNPIPDELRSGYERVLQHATPMVVNQLIFQTTSAYELLSEFHAAYQQVKLRHGGWQFHDIPRLLHQGRLAGVLDATGHRLDGDVEHLLLDEFQDTSPEQWQVLLPLAQRTVESGADRSFFCVGDEKQAIYGWRGGASEIFDLIGQQLPGLEFAPLNTSFRSCPTVIETVNRVFGQIGTNPVVCEVSPEAAAAWQQRYQNHSTNKTLLAGHVRVSVAGQPADSERQPIQTLRDAAALVKRLVAQAPLRSVGVLTRTNKAVARMIYELRTIQGVPASEEGGNPLTDSLAVQLMLSLLRLADHPGHTVALFHVKQSRLGAAVGLTEGCGPAGVNRVAAALRARLLADGYGRTIYDLAKSLVGECDDRELRRLTQLVELAHRHDSQRTLRPSDFVRLVEETRVPDPGQEAVRVMTIHQAKGLQFDIVVLPELDWSLKGRPPEIVVDQASAIAPITRVLRYAGEEKQVLLPAECQAMLKAWIRPRVSESLCLLYVALTRAVHALHIVLSPPYLRQPSGSAGKALIAALGSGATPSPGAVLYEAGNERWHEPGRPPILPGDGATVAAAEPVLEIRLRRSAAREEGPSPSRRAHGPSISAAQLLSLDDTATERGRLMHGWFELIRWLDDGPPSDEELQRAVLRLAPGLMGDGTSAHGQEGLSSEVAAYLSQFRAALAKPAVAAALSQGGYRDLKQLGWNSKVAAELSGRVDELRVCREQSFSSLDEDGFSQGVIDRLVLLISRGQVVAADVLDFKTDSAANPEALEALVERYRPQLTAYRKAASKLLRLPENRITARLVFTSPGVVRNA